MRRDPISTYRHVVVTKPGRPDVLRIAEDEVAEPGPRRVRVKILASGHSFADLLMREGVHLEAPSAARTRVTKPAPCLLP